MGISAVAYDTRFKIRTRLKIQHLWNSGAVSIIIATNNFGIGVSKQTVRFTVHWYALSSIANYYQESGRAGHDDVCMQ
ncbi:PREDICTED: ATP-dependent DNA helicase Q5-like [Ceratosolen solmsi marchali]|uniref:DNA 3'-5' helicase n=1 Tax=Ceratosolen solmsi marchali TaxID=326594 RepID=A0AAJ7DT48_9HYME|nr:PREDICTED: ATP-dependent DNA helicase Q5-like [Ceratosolen solmsi marchali]